MSHPVSIINAIALALVLAACSGNKQEPQAGTAPTTAPANQNDPGDIIPADKQPTIVSKVEPVYPRSALAAGIEAKVWTKVLISKEGKVEKVEVTQGNNDHPEFDSAAVRAAQQFVFNPATAHGEPVAVWVSIPFVFKVAEKSDAAPALGKDTDARYRAGYVAGRKAALSTLEQRAREERLAGRPDTTLERMIEKEKAAIGKLEKQ